MKKPKHLVDSYSFYVLCLANVSKALDTGMTWRNLANYEFCALSLKGDRKFHSRLLLQPFINSSPVSHTPGAPGSIAVYQEAPM